MERARSEDRAGHAVSEWPALIGVGANQHASSWRFVGKSQTEALQHPDREIETNVGTVCSEPDADLSRACTELDNKLRRSDAGDGEHRRRDVSRSLGGEAGAVVEPLRLAVE